MIKVSVYVARNTSINQFSFAIWISHFICYKSMPIFAIVVTVVYGSIDVCR